MIGVNFQPGTEQGPQSGSRPVSPTGVQEAIKVLSLRLPKTVGAQAVSPQGLLSSQGSGGQRVESVVNQVMAKMFPNGGNPSQSMPSFGTAPPPSEGPSFTGAQSGGGETGGYTQSGGYTPPTTNIYAPPHVIVGNGLGTGDFSIGSDGRPSGNPGGIFESLPTMPNFTDGSGMPPAAIETLPKRSPFPEYGWGGSQEAEQPPAI